MPKQIIKNVLLFLGIFLALNLIFGAFRPDEKQKESLTTGDIGIVTTEQEYPLGKTVMVTIRNNTASSIVLKSECPSEPLTVRRFDAPTNAWMPIAATYQELDCTKLTDLPLEAGAETVVSYEPWNNGLFSSTGRYTIAFAYGEKTFSSNEFIVTERGIFRTVWYHGLFRPIYNVLIFFAKILPFHSLGSAIILLTILIRVILFFPSQQAMRSQKKMQALQPLLEKIKKKYEGNQKRISEETMHVWKEHKVNPFGGCLPLIIQLPILIALFYVIQSGIQPDDMPLLYPFLRDFPLAKIDVHFFNLLDLTKTNRYWLPILVGALQFIQMKMAVSAKKSPTGEQEMQQALHTTQKMMTYMMPVMIAVFTASVPAGVGLYWGISTIVGIGQQWLVNREKAVVQ